MRRARTVRAAAVALALVAAFVLCLFALPMAMRARAEGSATGTGAGTPTKEGVEELDNIFDPSARHVAPGSTVEWTNDGRNPHTVTADDGSFDSGNQAPGATYTMTFPKAGVYRYYCRYHGGPNGIGMAGVIVVGDATLTSPGGVQVGPGFEPPPSGPGHTLKVPSGYPTIQAAVDAAKPGDLILIAPGVYHEGVMVTTPFLTIRGEDRNTTILDGDFERANGIQVTLADGVAIENLTARHYLLNGFYWATVNGYRGSWLTAYADGDYGLYAFDSVYGRFDFDYASGHPDSGFYIGQCFPCHAVIDQVTSEDNALGYSGTNAGGDLIIVNSIWQHNMAGIVPNTLDSEGLAPQRQVTIEYNVVQENNNRSAPAKALQYPSIGTGILLAGGVGNVVRHNKVFNHENYGIAVLPNIDQRIWISQENQVKDNEVRGSGRADLTLAGPAGQGNCFSGNDYRTSLPPAIQILYGCGHNLMALGGGDLSSAIQALALFIQAQGGDYPHGDWRTAPAPRLQAGMPNATTALAVPAVPVVDVPGPYTLQGPGLYALRFIPQTKQEVTVLGVSLAAPTWWSLLLATYAYLLPLILYVAWVSIAMWDLIRQEQMPNNRRIGWMAIVLLVPLLGPILYFVIGRSPIPAPLRTMLVAGGMGVYVIFAVLSVLIGS